MHLPVVRKCVELADEMQGLKHVLRYAWPQLQEGDYAVLSLVLQQVAKDLQEILAILGDKIKVLQKGGEDAGN